jgi:hypothetical protein
MRRREWFIIIGSAVAWPFGAWAQRAGDAQGVGSAATNSPDGGSNAEMPLRARQRFFFSPAASSQSPSCQDRLLRRPRAAVVQGTSAANDGNGLRLP